MFQVAFPHLCPACWQRSSPDLLRLPLGQQLLIAELVSSLNLRHFTVIKLSAAVIYNAVSERGVEEEQGDGATGFGAASNNGESTDAE